MQNLSELTDNELLDWYMQQMFCAISKPGNAAIHFEYSNLYRKEILRRMVKNKESEGEG
jgi:hypothetical protein